MITNKKIFSGDYEKGDHLLTNNNKISVSNIQIDRVDGLEVRLAKEQSDTTTKIKEIYEELNNRSEALLDKINLERKIIEEELNKIKKALIWVSVIVFGLFVSVGFALNYIFNKL